MYYNTTNESEKIKEFRQKTAGQDIMVLDIALKRGQFSPSEIFLDYPVQGTPFTSIRRSINTLMKKGLIAKIGSKVLGMYGRHESQYKTINNEN